jgi:hypothetical protein
MEDRELVVCTVLHVLSANVAIYLLKTVATKVSFLTTIPIHFHSYFFLISSVASSAPFGQELGRGWYKKWKTL